jgi:hypothetical protein
MDDRELWKFLEEKKTVIGNTTEFDVVKKSLRELYRSEQYTSIRTREVLSSWQEYVLSQLQPNWGYCFSKEERVELLEAALLAGDKMCLIRAIERTLSKIAIDVNRINSLPEDIVFILEQIDR